VQASEICIGSRKDADENESENEVEDDDVEHGDTDSDFYDSDYDEKDGDDDLFVANTNKEVNDHNELTQIVEE
jgi:hypothetical protein